VHALTRGRAGTFSTRCPRRARTAGSLPTTARPQVIPALLQNPARKFIYVEIAFFMRWWPGGPASRCAGGHDRLACGASRAGTHRWHEQNDDMKATVRQLVAERRLEVSAAGTRLSARAPHRAACRAQFINGGWSASRARWPAA
jgi:hypothetical protein